MNGVTNPASGELVTVLMPMRNAGRFLGEAVSSVLDQDHANLELLVIDDGSTDGSREAVMAMSDARIRLIDGPRAGISACLNRGLEQARGSVLMRCDSDDVYPPGRIRLQLDWLAAHPDFIAVCAPFEMISPEGDKVASPLRHEVRPDLDGARRILDGRLRTHLCTFAFRKDVAVGLGGFRPFFETAEDIDFTLRLAAAGAIGCLPAVAYLYRLHGASITHTQGSARRQFFERTAYAMSKERLATGTDAVARGAPPVAPPADRPEGAGGHIANLLVGEAWQAFGRADRMTALRTIWRAIRAQPWHLSAWRSLLIISLKPVRRPA